VDNIADDIEPLAIAIAIIATLGAAAGVTWSIYASGRDYAQHVTIQHDRPAKVRQALNQECRQVDDVTGALDEAALEGWVVTGCSEPGCARTDSGERTVYVPDAASDVARHEYVHACLFAAGWPGDSHHAWMRSHCSFCHGSPACAGPCLQEEK
jgi:hypothetical protein